MLMNYLEMNGVSMGIENGDDKESIHDKPKAQDNTGLDSNHKILTTDIPCEFFIHQDHGDKPDKKRRQGQDHQAGHLNQERWQGMDLVQYKKV